MSPSAVFHGGSFFPSPSRLKSASADPTEEASSPALGRREAGAVSEEDTVVMELGSPPPLSNSSSICRSVFGCCVELAELLLLRPPPTTRSAAFIAALH